MPSNGGAVPLAGLTQSRGFAPKVWRKIAPFTAVEPAADHRYDAALPAARASP